MISCWSDWKTYPDAARGDSIKAPIGPGLYEVRHVSTGAVFAFGAADNVALDLVRLSQRKRGFLWLTLRAEEPLPDLEYRTCATSTKAEARAAANHMLGRREAFLSGAA